MRSWELALFQSSANRTSPSSATFALLNSLILCFNDCSLTAILVSRFLIDLQAANQRTVRIFRDDNMFLSGIDGEDSEDCTTTTLSFAGFDVVGSLGTQLKPGEHASFGISTDDSDALEGMDRFRDEDGMEMSPIDSKAAGSC